MEILNYLLPVNLYLLLFYAFYRLVLRNETFFKLNRVYLIGSALFSFLIPLIRSPWVQDLFITEQVRQVTQTANLVVYTLAPTAAEEARLSGSEILLFSYLAGMFVFLCLFLVKVVKMNRLLRQQIPNQAYSFFGKIAVDPNLSGQKTIHKHELVHARQFHSADVIFFELIAIINWFNPVIYLYKKAVKHIHEFIADEESARHEHTKADYALLLLSNTLGVQPHQLTNSFFNQSLLKRRIIMLHKTKSNRTAMLKYGMAVPLFAGMLVFSAATISPENIAKNVNRIAETKPEPSFKKPAIVIRSGNLSTDYNEFIKHVSKTVRYPLSARQNNTQEQVLVSFTINPDKSINQILSDSEQLEFTTEIKKSVLSYKGALLEKPGVYTLTVNFEIDGMQKEKLEMPNPKPENYIGAVTVIGYGSTTKSVQPSSTKVEKTITPDTQDTDVRDFASVEKLPEFPGGGMQAFIDFLSKNYKYPAEARKQGVSGRVIMSFVVEKDGSLTDIKVIRDLGFGTGAEAIRLLESSPKWKPGLQDGRPVRVAYTLPFNLDLAKQEQQVEQSMELTIYQINGKEVSKEEFDNFRKSSNNFTWINTMLKPEKAVELYGVKAKNGAIVLNLETKK